MIKAIYQAQLRKGEYKSLGYAIPLMKALSGDLTINVSARSGCEPGPSSKEEGSNRRLPPVFPPDNRQLPKTDLIIWGKPKSALTMKRAGLRNLKNTGCDQLPVLFVPYSYPFAGIRRMLFAGNRPGLFDEPLLIRIASVFLPRIWNFDDSGLTRLLWRQPPVIPGAPPEILLAAPDHLTQYLEKSGIDLIVLTLPAETGKADGILRSALVSRIRIPLLIFPPPTEACTAGGTENLHMRFSDDLTSTL